MNMRGQVTAEYLLLVALGISLLAVSLVALTSIKGAEAQVYAREKARIIAGDVSSIGNEICALGDGNSRAYSLENAELGCVGKTITVFVSGASANSTISDCEIECGGEYSGEIRIRNSHGNVVIGAG
ncbi:hypothetical protein H0O01_01305 [Candidatus Micrarchaeota archaeon]|nr:hypothetical protein [Candidatus Micrarchaeota archaeon]